MKQATTDARQVAAAEEESAAKDASQALDRQAVAAKEQEEEETRRSRWHTPATATAAAPMLDLGTRLPGEEDGIRVQDHRRELEDRRSRQTGGVAPDGSRCRVLFLVLRFD